MHADHCRLAAPRSLRQSATSLTAAVAIALATWLGALSPAWAQYPGQPCPGGCQPCIQGVDCNTCSGAEARWSDMKPMNFQAYAQGEYAGPPRLAHLAEYRLRPNDEIQLIYLITRRQTSGEYRMTVGDEVLIESISNEDLQRGTLESGLQIQPDGTITVRLLGQVHAAGLTVDQLRRLLEKKYQRFYNEPAIDVTPVKTNTLAEDIRNAVGGQSGLQQQAVTVRVTPDGKIRLPGVGAVSAQGLSLSELKQEINLRYQQIVVGLEVEPILAQQAPHFVYVLGEVGQSNRFQMDTPTTVLGAIAMAGGYQRGANMRQVVVLRRADDWRLVATMLDLQGAVLGKRPTPADEIWLRDGDVVIVPKSPIRVLNDFVQQVFTDGIYGIVPFEGVSVEQISF
ncbi:polysaccharide biosynthesis/export family protein [Roseimaritima ulvae]|uniref:Polysaccharide biosynthesis/export protein n=1 Tax=Roseimaritima ulvae TaxID=980254 RepID=A0A5B9QN17_9BACT|nr:polysaccharide biosynthesis/export family protein [Roseimaritima ulvae]QEG40354.1 Polysaccharide biosynthesis/export protein [Roseimaritima ulvae]